MARLDERERIPVDASNRRMFLFPPRIRLLAATRWATEPRETSPRRRCAIGTLDLLNSLCDSLPKSCRIHCRTRFAIHCRSRFAIRCRNPFGFIAVNRVAIRCRNPDRIRYQLLQCRPRLASAERNTFQRPHSRQDPRLPQRNTARGEGGCSARPTTAASLETRFWAVSGCKPGYPSR